MILNGCLGNTTKTGIAWELKTDFNSLVHKTYNYNICEKSGELIDVKNEEHINIFSVPKYKLYNHLNKVYKIDCKEIGTKIYGDEVIINNHNKNVFIIEKKSQQCNGSVDEKIQTCDFKKKQLQKIFNQINQNDIKFTVHYIYLLNDWFKKPKYKDVIEYIKSVGCEVFFEKIDENRMSNILYRPSN